MIAHEVCKLHEHDILHLDLKPDNFIINVENPNFVHLIDFGFSYPLDIASHLPVTFGTPYYLNPPNSDDLKDFPLYSKKTDIYALGVIFLVLLDRHLNMQSIPTGNKYLDRSNFYQHRISRYTYFTDPHKNTLLKTLLLNMIDVNPVKRPSCEEIIITLSQF